MALCLRERVAKDYAKMNAATLVGKDGAEIHLYSRLLALLLRLSAIRGGDVAEIAFRTQEVLDQFVGKGRSRRNEDSCSRAAADVPRDRRPTGSISARAGLSATLSSKSSR